MRMRSITLWHIAVGTALWAAPRLIGAEPKPVTQPSQRQVAAWLLVQASSGSRDDRPDGSNGQPAEARTGSEPAPALRSVSDPPRSPSGDRPQRCIYRAPRFSTHRVRVVSVSRSDDPAQPQVRVLAPDHPGLTSQARPQLYYHLSQPVARLEVTLTLPGRAQPVFEMKSAGPVTPGVHRLDLAEQDIPLPLDVECEWYVAVVRDPERRSRDTISRGIVKRVRPDSALLRVVEKGDVWEVPAAYADAGFWYDALSSLAELQRQQPENPAIGEEIQRLLAQADLNGISADLRERAD